MARDNVREECREMLQVVQILLVEDNPGVANSLRIMIERKWFKNVKVVLAETAEEAWEAMTLRVNSFDAFILDNTLGEGARIGDEIMTGPKLFVQLKQELAGYSENTQGEPMPCAIHSGETVEELKPDAQQLITNNDNVVYFLKGDVKTPVELRRWIGRTTKGVYKDGPVIRKVQEAATA